LEWRYQVVDLLFRAGCDFVGTRDDDPTIKFCEWKRL